MPKDSKYLSVVEGSKPNRRSFVKAIGASSVVGLSGCLGALQGGSNEEWPSQQVEIVSPWAAGGSADQTSRAIADAAERLSDVAWVVSNQTGGSGSVGMQAAANAGAGGHTLGVAAGEICMFQHLGISDLGPDSVRPVMQYTTTPSTVTVHEDSGWETLEDFVNYAQNNQVDMSNSGTGGTYHIAGAGFAMEAGIGDNVNHIPYDGGDPAITAVVNQEADVTASGAPEVAPQVNDGPLKCLGVMSDSEHSALPGVPTLASGGYDLKLGSWLAGFVSPDVPDETHQRIVDMYNQVYEDEQFVQFMEDGGYEMKKRNPDELKQFMDEQYQRYGEIISELGLGQ